jgi:serine/threonine protein kinase
MSAGFEIGSVVADRYRIDGSAGAGGMGVVYRAYDLRVARVVALKVIAAELAHDPEFRLRFEGEIASAAQIEHPNVVPIYDCGEGPGDELFVVMRYVDGINLAELIAARGCLDPPLAAQIVSQIASALDAAHALGVVHRDVKPANVLIAESDAAHAYLTDFGLAKRVSAQTTAGPALTRLGMMVGTVQYMAPEQAEGQPVDLRADVYALGSVLYEALTGSLPYPGNTDVSILYAKLSHPTPVPSQVSPGLAVEFDTVIARSLARDPRERFPSAGELGHAALGAAAKAPLPPTIVAQEVGTGSVLADCLIEDVVGEGGMAIVYRATQLKLGRNVALKVMARELASDASFRARFERESRLAASIDHPNVIPIYLAGEANGLLFVVMRLVEGRNLREILLGQGAPEPEQAVTVIEQVAAALDAAHTRGLLHRDVKPANVLVDDATGRVYLTDFGLAKALDDHDDLTESGQILGTTRYLAPERSRGLGGEDARVDIYSLGCLLWDLLGGVERRDLSEIAGVGPELTAVVLKAIELEPSARFASAGELARAARRAIDGPDPAAAPGGDSVTATGAGASAQRMPRGSIAGHQPFGPAPLTTGLRQRVSALCDSLLGSLDGDTGGRERIAAVQCELREPLRLSLVGAGGAGKSTLANGLPADVRRGLTLSIGPNATTSTAHPVSGEVPQTGAGATTADVVMLVHPADASDPEGDRLHDTIAGLGLSALNAMVALSKADLLRDDEAVASMVADLRRRLGPRAAVVVPTRGLLAEAANVGTLGDRETELLARLARLPPEIRAALLVSPEALAAGDSPLEPEDRRHLLDLMGIYGVRHGLALADAGQLSTVALIRRLRELSGIEDVTREIQRFDQRADALKAGRALDRLEELAYSSPQLAFVRDRVEEIRYEPPMHLLDLARAYERCLSDGVELPAQLLQELERLITGRSLAERLGLNEGVGAQDLRAAARHRVREWKVFENAGHASARARRVARVVARSYEIIATRELSATSTEG